MTKTQTFRYNTAAALQPLHYFCLKASFKVGRGYAEIAPGIHLKSRPTPRDNNHKWC